MDQISEKFIFQHYGENVRKLTEAGRGWTDRQEAFYQSNAYIENQSEWGNIDFGITNMAYAGCEIMAVYNARLSLGEDMTAEEMAGLIQVFERRGAVLGGIFGTAPTAVYQYFRDTGYHTGMATDMPEEEMDAFGEEYDTAIITFFNNRDDIKCQVHTVNVSKERGGFVCHNAGLDQAGGNMCRSLSEAVGRVACGKAKLISIIGIN